MADQQAQRPQMNVGVVRRGAVIPGGRRTVGPGMTGFREHFPSSATAQTEIPRAHIGVFDNVDLLTAVNPTVCGRVLMTCVRLMSTMLEPVDPFQLCAYYGSILCSVMPSLQPMVTKALREAGATVVERRMPDAQAETAIELEAVARPAACLCIFGQAVLLLYKNISPLSYDTFMRNRISAMRASLGIPYTADLQAFSYDDAVLIRTIMGASVDLRKLTMELLIASCLGGSQLNTLCSYLCSILAWTDMAGLVFINDTLLSTNSPVLRDSRVVSEVRNVAYAFLQINSETYPQFYRIMRHASQTKMLERSKFPTLIAVAQQLRMEQYSTASQFVSTLPSSNTTVTALVRLHKEALGPAVAPAISRILPYLTTYSDEDFFENEGDGVVVEHARPPPPAT